MPENLLQRFMAACYTLGLSLALPFIFLRLFIRGKKQPGYRAQIWERLGWLKKNKRGHYDIWVHAVSLGETHAITPWIHQALQRNPNLRLLLSHTTASGRQTAMVLAQTYPQITTCYLPYDLPWIWALFFRQAHPKHIMLVETELWPCWLKACQKRRIPVSMANARLSAPSLRRYLRFHFFFAPYVASLHAVFAQFPTDAKRFKHLGVPKNRIHVMGNVKFDHRWPSDLQASADTLKTSLGNPAWVWVGASTHEGEEALLLEAHRLLLNDCPKACLLLVPRHPERGEQVAALLTEKKFSHTRYHNPQKNTSVVLVDQLGVLGPCYAACDAAVVGGSFVPIGGHNVLEPASLGKPCVVGPHTQHFTSIVHLLQRHGGLVTANNAQELYEQLKKWLTQPELAHHMGIHAKAALIPHQGATQRLYDFYFG